MSPSKNVVYVTSSGSDNVNVVNVPIPRRPPTVGTVFDSVSRNGAYGI